MNNGMKIFIAAVAVFCSYLILSLPFSSALQINFIFNQASLGSVTINPQGLVSKELSIEHDTLWSKINAHLEVRVSQPQYEIKKAYVYFCGGLDPIDCITKDPVTFESYVNVSRNWNDIFSGQAYQYPQTTNILTMVRIDIGGKIAWTGFWDHIERTSTREFKIRSYDISSLDAYLKSGEYLNLTKSFVEKYMMIPTQWVESTSFGMINQTDTQVLYGVGANQSEMPLFRPWKTLGRTVGQVGKEYEFVFPGTSSFIANPVTINSNPPYVCGNSICETDAGESQENCCLDCSDPQTRTCTGEFEGYRCYVDEENPYGYCGSKCGENGCERGEDSSTCCSDCSCAPKFICDMSQWNPSGTCLNSSAINLILDSAKTQYTSCEIPHDIEFNVHIMNPPSDLRIQQWYYTLNTNETGTSISSDRATVIEGPNVTAPHMYSIKIHHEPLPECVIGTHIIKDNTLFALVSYAGGSEFKELSVSIPDITIYQDTISMKQIQENLKMRMMAVMDFIEEGMEMTKMMLKLCIIVIISMLVMAMLAGISYAFGGGKTFGPGGSTQQTAGLPGSGDSDLGAGLSFAEETKVGYEFIDPETMKAVFIESTTGSRQDVTNYLMDKYGKYYNLDEIEFVTPEPLPLYEFINPFYQKQNVIAGEGEDPKAKAATIILDDYGIGVEPDEIEFLSGEEAADFIPAELADPSMEKIANPYTDQEYYYPSLGHAYADISSDGILTWPEAEAYADGGGRPTTVGSMTEPGTAEPPVLASSEESLFRKMAVAISEEWLDLEEEPLEPSQPVVVTDGSGKTFTKKGPTWYEVLGGATGGALKVVGDGTFAAVKKASGFVGRVVSPQTKTVSSVDELNNLPDKSTVKIGGKEFTVRNKKWYETRTDGSEGLVSEMTTIDNNGNYVTYEEGSPQTVMAHSADGNSVEAETPSYGGRIWSGIKTVAGGVGTGVKTVAGGIGKVATGFWRFFDQYGKALEFGFGVAQQICNVASMLIQIFTSVTQVWTKYIAFQTCMEMYENQLGKGLCDKNPESCVNQMLGCLNSLEGIKQDAQNMIPEIGSTSYAGGRGTVSASLVMNEVGRAGTIKETCNARSVYFTLFYGYYSELTMVFRTPRGSGFMDCGTDRTYAETDMKAFLPLTEDRAESASNIFDCGDGRYHFSLYGDNRNIGNLIINYKQSCEEAEGTMDKSTVTEVGGHIRSAHDIVSNIKGTLNAKTQGDAITYLGGAIREMNAAKKAASDNKDIATITGHIETAEGKIDNAKKLSGDAGLSAAEKDDLDDALVSLTKAKDALK